MHPKFMEKYALVVYESNCRGEACKKVFKEKEDDWLGRKLPNVAREG
jgi:hypothetical protein